jgi:hypothetical protein
MKNPHQQQIRLGPPASFGPFRKQLCREDTWEEVVRTQLKRDWLMQLDEMIPSIPNLVPENNTRDKKTYFRRNSVAKSGQQEEKRRYLRSK